MMLDLSEDFISHVEETLMAVTDTHSQSETIQELEEVYAYGDKSRFQDMMTSLNKYYKQDDQYYEYEDSPERDVSIRDDEFEYFTKIDNRSAPSPPVNEKDNPSLSPTSNVTRKIGSDGNDKERSEHLKTIDNPLDVDIKRLFNKARRKLKFPGKNSHETKYSWSENLIRKGIGKPTETNMIGSSDQDDLSINNKSTRTNKTKESFTSESSSTDNGNDNDDDLGVGGDGGGVHDRDKYHDSYELQKVEGSIRNGISKSDKQSQRNGDDYKWQKKYQIRQNNFQKISEDKYLKTIRQNADNKQKMRSKYKKVQMPARNTVKIRNPERIIRKINNLNDNVYNEEEREAPFELLKPTSQLESMLVKWGNKSNRNSVARKTTTTQRSKLRRRKKKKAGRPEPETEPEEDTKPEKIQKDLQEKVKKPLKTEWNSIFQGTKYPRKKYLKSTSTTTTSRPTQFSKKSVRREKSKREPEHSMLRRLVEKYCQFENSLGIMRLCESPQLSNTRKHLEDPLSEVTALTRPRPQLNTETNTEKDFLWNNEETEEGSFVENVKSAFKNIFSYF